MNILKNINFPIPYILVLAFTIILIFIKIERFQTFIEGDVVLFYTDWCEYSRLFLDIWEPNIK